MGKLLLSRRYNSLPLLRSRPGGVQKELAVKDLPATKVENFSTFLVLIKKELVFSTANFTAQEL